MRLSIFSRHMNLKPKSLSDLRLPLVGVLFDPGIMFWTHSIREFNRALLAFTGRCCVARAHSSSMSPAVLHRCLYVYKFTYSLSVSNSIEVLKADRSVLHFIGEVHNFLGMTGCFRLFSDPWRVYILRSTSKSVHVRSCDPRCRLSYLRNNQHL
jgi:hypothetical protein